LWHYPAAVKFSKDNPGTNELLRQYHRSLRSLPAPQARRKQRKAFDSHRAWRWVRVAGVVGLKVANLQPILVDKCDRLGIEAHIPLYRAC